MTIHYMNLQPRYFNYIKSGTKRIELRLNDEKRRQLQLGDTIVFTSSEGESISVKITGLLSRFRVSIPGFSHRTIVGCFNV